MQTLTPKQASVLADGVYALKDQSVSQTIRRGDISLGTEGLFELQDSSRFQGQSGAPLFKRLSGFGYIAEGVGSYKGHMVCATRGTVSLADWLTDGSVGMQTGPSGYQVHIGFHQTWKSYMEEVRAFLRGKNPTHIHCVGHSLGGALAMLNADFFTANKVAGVSVYTFGAPRVGSRNFSSDLTRRIGADRIFRVSHIADPVPMIPTFPFLHLPYSAPAFVIGTGLISFGAHSMTDSYAPRVADLSWGSFPTDAQPPSDEKIEEWLGAANGAGGVKMYSAYALYMIGAALKWLLKKIGVVLGGVITLGTAAFTLLDRIAWMISKGIEISKDIANYGVSLIRAVMRFLGRVANTVQELTMAYLRWIFGLLFSAMASAANMALSIANRGQ